VVRVNCSRVIWVCCLNSFCHILVQYFIVTNIATIVHTIDMCLREDAISDDAKLLRHAFGVLMVGEKRSRKIGMFLDYYYYYVLFVSQQ
jgi:hypothetical protein